MMKLRNFKRYLLRIKLIILNIFLGFISLTSCTKKINNELFSETILSKYALTSYFPMPNVKTTSLMSDTNLFVSLDDSEYSLYVKQVYDYLLSNNYYYVGTYKQDGLVAEMLPRYVYTPIDNTYNFNNIKHKFIYSPTDELHENNGDSSIDICFEIRIERVEDSKYAFYKKETYNTIIRLGEMICVYIY